MDEIIKQIHKSVDEGNFTKALDIINHQMS